MEIIEQFVMSAAWIIIGLIGLYILIFKILGLRIIGTNEVGVVEKWWSPKGNLKSIDIIPKTIIPVGFAGVVNSLVGKKGVDVTDSTYTHGELVEEGCKGIWANPLKPGKYSYNLSAGILTQVPTTNFILKWVQSEVGGHKFDENLKEVTLITMDAFEPTLPLSVVVHIDYKKAPLVIQRFGDIKRLVDQTLDPMVSSYFKNIGQKMTLIQLIQNRSEIQKQATEEMKTKFQNYNLELEEVLIGTPSPNGDKKIKEGKINIVPNNVVTMGGVENSGNVNAVENLLAVLLLERLGTDFEANIEDNDFAKKMKEDIYIRR